MRSTWNLARGLAKLGVEVTVLTTNAKQKGILDVTPDRVEEGVKIITAPVLADGRSAKLNRVGVSPAHWNNIVKHVPLSDIVHINGVWGPTPSLSVMACRLFGKPCLMSTRGNLENNSLARKAAKKRFALALGARKIIQFVWALHYTTDRERNASPSWTANIESFVLPNPVEMVPPADGGNARKRLGIDKDTLLLGAFGRVHKQKGLDIPVRAMAKSDNREGIKFLVVGPDEGYTKDLKAITESNGLSGQVIFTGELSGVELAEAYAAIDMLALSSHHESFGNVVVEAMVQGTSALVSDQVGLKDWVAKNDAGLVLPLNMDAWAGAFTNLEKAQISKRWEPDRIERLARESFSLEAVARMMLLEYERILKDSVKGATKCRSLSWA